MLKILYEDKAAVIIEKPAEMLSEPSAGGDDVITVLSAQLGARCFPVHRLDRGTGGAMLIAKTSAAAAEFSRLIQERSGFEKKYLAVISGVPEEAEGRFEDLLFKDSQKNKVFIVKRERRGVKKAVLVGACKACHRANAPDSRAVCRAENAPSRRRQIRKPG